MFQKYPKIVFLTSKISLKNWNNINQGLTVQKWQWLLLLLGTSVAIKFDFFSLSVLSKTVENECFN